MSDKENCLPNKNAFEKEFMEAFGLNITVPKATWDALSNNHHVALNDLNLLKGFILGLHARYSSKKLEDEFPFIVSIVNREHK